MLISIIIPIYNAEKYLRQCLNSIISQTYQDWECILVDDGSSDGSPAICDEYVKKDSRFKVVHKSNEGVSAARNDGLEKAKGEWIYFCDADDRLYDENSLNTLLRLTENADLAVAGYVALDEETQKEVHLELIRPYTGVLDGRSYIFEYLESKKLIGFIGHLWNKLFKREIIDTEQFRFATDQYYAEDLLFVVQYVSSSKCHAISIDNQQKIYSYYQHVGSAMASIWKHYNPSFFTDFVAYERILNIVHQRFNDVQLDNIAQYRLCQEGFRHLDMMEDSHFTDASKVSYILKSMKRFRKPYDKSVTSHSLAKMKDYVLKLPLDACLPVVNGYLHSEDCQYKYLNMKWKIAWIISHIAGQKGLWFIRRRMNFNSGN